MNIISCFLITNGSEILLDKTNMPPFLPCSNEGLGKPNINYLKDRFGISEEKLKLLGYLEKDNNLFLFFGVITEKFPSPDSKWIKIKDLAGLIDDEAYFGFLMSFLNSL